MRRRRFASLVSSANRLRRKARGSRVNSCEVRRSSSSKRASRLFCSMSENGGASRRLAVATKSLVVAEAMLKVSGRGRRNRMTREGRGGSRPSAISFLPQIEFNLYGLPERDRLAALHCRAETQLVGGLNRLLVEPVGQT